MKKISGIFLAALMLSGCGYQGQYRYPCQDPANWANAECNPPICEVSGTCSRDLVGQEVWDEYEKSKVKNG